MEEDKLILTKKNEAFLHIETSRGIEMELQEHFTFFVPGYRFIPKFKEKRWDGKIRLFNRLNKCIYHGLRDEVVQYAQKHSYPVIDDTISKNEFSPEEAEEFLQLIQLDRTRFKDRDYQINAFLYAIRHQRMLLLSPVASGKSLIIYLICRYLLEKELVKKLIIMVPTIALVEQMTKDFIEYGWDEKWIHKIYAGKSKDTLKPVTISTWESLFRLPDKYFHQFEAVVGDEAQEFKSTETKGILERLIYAKYRIGTTGSMHDAKTHKLVLQGLFGPLIQFVTTKQLMDRGDISKLKIKCVVLHHDLESRKIVEHLNYDQEIAFLISNNKRNQFIKKLAISLKGNTLILFKRIEKHGKVLYDLINNNGKKVYYISGETEIEEREMIRGLLEKVHDAILIASTGTFSRGSNVKNLHNVIFSHPTKDKIKTLQSIGRSLRLHDDKEQAILYDLADNFKYGRHENITMKHFKERLKLYRKEKFDFKIYEINLKEGK